MYYQNVILVGRIKSKFKFLIERKNNKLIFANDTTNISTIEATRRAVLFSFMAKSVRW